VIEAFALGQLRTSGVSGLATDLLAEGTADELAIVGSGKQALAQVAAVASVRRLRRVRVFSPTAAHRESFAARIERELGIAAQAVASVEACTHEAPLLTLVTRARAPFLESAMVARGAHVNAVGAIAPERAEVAVDVLARVSLAVADSPAQARRLSSELGDSALPLHALCDIVAGRVRRPEAPDVTLFKAMGTGHADVALGGAVLALARAHGFGRAIERPERSAPRLLTDGGGAAKPVTSEGDA
jgi:ornithine cyclodeaminase